MSAMTVRPAKPLGAGNVRSGAVITVVCLALATVVAAMSSLNVALPGIAAATHATQTQLAWIIDAYSLVFASLLLPAGAIGDRYGRRRALIIGLGIFGAGSAVAMTARSADELCAARRPGPGGVVSPGTNRLPPRRAGSGYAVTLESHQSTGRHLPEPALGSAVCAGARLQQQRPG